MDLIFKKLKIALSLKIMFNSIELYHVNAYQTPKFPMLIHSIDIIQLIDIHFEMENA